MVLVDLLSFVIKLKRFLLILILGLLATLGISIYTTVQLRKKYGKKGTTTVPSYFYSCKLLDSLVLPKPKELKEIENTPITTRGFHFKFENLALSITKNKKKIPILQNISGEFKSGELSAIMGPSGSGKTSLMSVLRGKVNKTEGTILVNGKKEDLQKSRKEIGYVPQVSYRISFV